MISVLIIGGGIAGTASALAQHQAGIAATFHEAHPHTSHDGGAFLTLEDAVILAKALRDHPDPDSAFTSYERLRRARVQANITAGANLSTPSRRPDPTDRQPRPRSLGAPDEIVAAQLDWTTPLKPPV